MILTSALFFNIGYLIGSIPYGLIIGKWSGKGDIRQIGSGNIGATNMLRTGSKKLAILTLIADVAKGSLAAYSPMLVYDGDINLVIVAGLGAVIGHIAPIWLKFKGGKGIATLIGALIIISPPTAAVFCMLWIGIALSTRYSSLASLCAATITPILIYLNGGNHKIAIMIIIAAIPITFKHKDNLKRLLQGTENKIRLKSNKK